MADDDVMNRLRYYQTTGQLDEAKNYEAYLRQTGQYREATPAPNAAKVRARQSANEMDQADAESPSYLSSALGGISALLKSVPGGEAAQAGARALVRGQPYTQALQDIRGAESDNPMSGVNSLIGGTVAAASMPGSPVVSGAGYGLLNGALQADGSVGDRAKSAAMQGATGAALGKILPAVASYAKSKFTPTIDVQQLARGKAMAGTDAKLYGAAEAEGLGRAGAPTAFQNPAVQEYLDMVKAAPQFRGADEATVMREAYKLMSRDQGGHASFMARNGFDAARQLKADALGEAKKELMAHAQSIMPSFPTAVSAHATNAQVSEAGQNASDVTQRILTGAHIRGDNLPLKSPAQFADDIKSMTKDEALASIDMMLGRAKEYRAGAKLNPAKLFGLGSNVARMAKLQPYLDLLAQQAGQAPIGATTRAVGLSAMSGLMNP